MTTHALRVSAADRWLKALLTLTHGQADVIKTVALLLMVTDHAGLLLADNNELMRLLGRGCFPLFGLVWDESGPTRGYPPVAAEQPLGLGAGRPGPFMLIGYPWYAEISCSPLPSPVRHCGGSACRSGVILSPPAIVAV
jgi:hypothetical protein